MVNASAWKIRAIALPEAARAAHDQIDRDTLVVLAEDCESEAAELERAKASALRRRLDLGNVRQIGSGADVRAEKRIRRWRMKAEELRSAAGSMKDPRARAGMRNAAATYEAIADTAEHALRGTSDQKQKAG